MNKVFVVWVTCKICIAWIVEWVSHLWSKHTNTNANTHVWNHWLHFGLIQMAWLDLAWLGLPRFWWWKAEFAGNQSKMGIIFENENGNENENATAHLIRLQTDFITSFHETKGAKANTASMVRAQYTITEKYRHWNRTHIAFLPSTFSMLMCCCCWL